MIGNYTAKEWLQMGNSFTPSQVEELIEGYEGEIKILEAENESQFKRFELVEEQEQFAKQALEEIVEAMNRTSNCRELKAMVNLAIENSSVEF